MITIVQYNLTCSIFLIFYVTFGEKIVYALLCVTLKDLCHCYLFKYILILYWIQLSTKNIHLPLTKAYYIKKSFNIKNFLNILNAHLLISHLIIVRCVK